MFNVGVIGCGFVAQGHLEAIGKSPDWHLKAVAEIDSARCRQAAERFHPDLAFTDYRDLLAVPDLDAVVVATHADTHGPITVEALRQNLHVLCEKPMAASLEECRQMMDAAQSARRLLAINFNTRSSHELRAIKELIDTGELGTIRVVRFVYTWSAHQWQPPERFEQFMRHGGPIIDSAVHYFEGVRWYTGQEFKHIHATGVFLPPYDAPQHAVANCILSDGSIALIEVGWLFTKQTKDTGLILNISVIGDVGTIDYNYNESVIRFWTRSRTERLACPDTGKHFEIVHAKFAESIRAGRLIELASGFDGYQATAAAYQALESARTNQKQFLSI